MFEPRVSVVIPVYNGAKWLGEALTSVYAQDMSEMEVIVLDDGSSDNSSDVVAQFHDPRCVSVRHANRGLAATLNRGIAMAKGRYVAREDQDDLLLPGRLSKQAAFLDEHSDVAMVGTWAHIYEAEHPSERFHRHPSSNEALQLALLFDNPFVHASVMIRADVLREVGGYSEDKERQPPEDYELWSRIAHRYRVANLPEVLTVYREFPTSMSRTGVSPFTARVVRISAENLKRALPNATAAHCEALATLYHWHGQDAGFRPAISKRIGLAMYLDAAVHIAGPMDSWTEEFQQTYARIRHHLEVAYLRTHVPSWVQSAARRLKHQLRRLFVA